MPSLEELLDQDTETLEQLLANNHEELLKRFGDCFKLEPDAPQTEHEDVDEPTGEGDKQTKEKKPKKLSKRAQELKEMQELIASVEKQIAEKAAAKTNQTNGQSNLTNNNTNPTN